MRDDRERLRDILEAIENIDRYAAQGWEKFAESELIQTWIVRHLQVIGEAAAKIREPFKGQTPEIGWAPIIPMRNILVHEYFAIDPEQIWCAVKNDLPELKHQIEKLLHSLDDSPEV